MKRLAIIAVAALVLSSCNELDGMVEGKAYKEAYDSNETRPRYVQVCMPRTHTSYVNGRSSTYTTVECHQQFSGYENYIQHHPECYEITVKQDEDGKMRTKCIAKSIYDSLDVGEHYSEKGEK